MKAKLVYTGIRVKDMDESLKFYTQFLGMKEVGRGTVESVRGEFVQLVSEENGPMLELNYYGRGSQYSTDYVAGEGLDHIAFQVEDLDKFKADAERAGHPLILEIKSVNSRWAYIEDPNGLWLEILS